MWQSSCAIEKIKARAAMYAQLRAFFFQRNILEVETPILSRSTATDPQLESISAQLRIQAGQEFLNYYLHTSPEFPMKRLLASGTGAIYQICKTFRNGETGTRHNPEFSMLEWYRPDFSITQLMDEVAALVSGVLGPISVTQLSYQHAFKRYLSIDPFEVSDQDLALLSKKLTHYDGPVLMRDDYLNLLLSHSIEPHLGVDVAGKICPVFLTEYPPSQSSLAQVITNGEGIKVAQRFELYIQGLELANGYFELTDATEQEARFEADNAERKALGLPEIPLDRHLLEAMVSGLPVCSGVAMGLDRLLMIKEKARSIKEVLNFPIERA